MITANFSQTPSANHVQVNEIKSEMGAKHLEIFHAIIIQQYCNNSSKAQNNNKEVDNSPSKKIKFKEIAYSNDNKTIIHLALVRPGDLSSPKPIKPA